MQTALSDVSISMPLCLPLSRANFLNVFFCWFVLFIAERNFMCLSPSDRCCAFMGSVMEIWLLLFFFLFSFSFFLGKRRIVTGTRDTVVDDDLPCPALLVSLIFFAWICTLLARVDVFPYY